MLSVLNVDYQHLTKIMDFFNYNFGKKHLDNALALYLLYKLVL